MIHQGKQQQALSHYNYVTDLFYRELGVSPSEPLRNLYREISKTVNSVETDPAGHQGGSQRVQPRQGRLLL